jgi:kallikrein
MLKVRAGEWDTSTDKETFPHTEHLVNDIVIHEKYNDKNKQNDIALLILKSPVKIAETVNTVCLPPQDLKFDGKRCFVTGECCLPFKV